MTPTKQCAKCKQVKPLDAFYRHPSTKDRRGSHCKACDNKRSREATGAKINRQRARHRAIADLIRSHEDEFEALLAIRLHEAREEAEALAKDPKAAEHYSEEPVRLRPGKRQPGEKAGDRIDVARCKHCIKHHDRGHVCAKCGAAPYAALRRPDDGIFDEIAVERAMAGDPVPLAPPERAEAIRRLSDRGESTNSIAKRLHISDKTIERVRNDLGIQSRWTA